MEAARQDVSQLGKSILNSRRIETKQRELGRERGHGINNGRDFIAYFGAVDEGPSGIRRLEFAEENFRSRRPATADDGIEESEVSVQGMMLDEGNDRARRAQTFVV